jgi:hypothetical protein
MTILVQVCASSWNLLDFGSLRLADEIILSSLRNGLLDKNHPSSSVFRLHFPGPIKAPPSFLASIGKTCPPRLLPRQLR